VIPMTNGNAIPARLITIPLSHYCEKAPWEQQNTTAGSGSTPDLHFEAGHAREMFDIVRDQSHTLRYRV
jgi:hypothetical protein